jgi:hypothetical protein
MMPTAYRLTYMRRGERVARNIDSEQLARHLCALLEWWGKRPTLTPVYPVREWI